MVKTGIDRIEELSSICAGKRVGLITNPTGVDSQLNSTVDLLNEHVNLVALFSPEHGIRGDLQAGVHLDTYLDPLTNITVYSLYGENRRPSKQMMDLIDVLVFDIQDVGARFYTYLYTMSYAMTACKEYNKQMVVIDRPNPVNAEAVEGNNLDVTFRSFVGYYSIPQRFGLTIGELANYFNEEEEIHCHLTVIPMEGYQRNMYFSDTGLPWVLPSPNIPTPETALLFLSTCIFEGTNLSEGRGTAKPFHFVGSPYLDSNLIVNNMNKKKLPGVLFRNVYFTPNFSKHQGVLCKGIELIVTNRTTFQPVKTGYILLDEIRKHHQQDFDYIPPFRAGGHPFIDLLAGDDSLRKETRTVSEIQSKMTEDEAAFVKKKRRYHLYD